MYLLTIDPARSLQLVGEAITCTERSGDHLINSIFHSNAGFAALSAGDIPAALAHLEAAAQTGQLVGYEDTKVMVYLGLVLRAEGDLDGAQSTLETGLRISRRNGDNWNIALACLGLLCLAGDLSDWERVAVLHGVSQAFLGRMGVQWDGRYVRYLQESLGQARAHLGDERLERAYAQGMALSVDEVLDLALRRAGPALSLPSPDPKAVMTGQAWRASADTAVPFASQTTGHADRLMRGHDRSDSALGGRPGGYTRGLPGQTHCAGNARWRK